MMPESPRPIFTPRLGAVALAMCLAAALTGPAFAQGDCITFDPPLLLDTSAHQDDPPIDRSCGIQMFWWGGHQYMMQNRGNQLEIIKVDDPENPISVSITTFTYHPFGDRDYNLFNFSVCDDCRYGMAGFEAMGSELVDLGTGATPNIHNASSHHYYQAATGYGGFTFTHNNQQYLIIDNVVSGCGDHEALVTINGLQSTDMQLLQCVVDGAGAPVTVDGGFYLTGTGGAAYVYLVGRDSLVHMYRISGTGTNLRLQALGENIHATWVMARGIDLDLNAPAPWSRLAVATSPYGSEIWDLEDPGDPLLLVNWRPDAHNPMQTVGIKYPYIWLGVTNTTTVDHTYDITDPSSPEELDPDVWAGSQDWNSYHYSGDINAAFSPDAGYLFLSRWSVLERFKMCINAAPVANYSITPATIFPGDTARVANTSTGSYTLSAIWISNSLNTVVAGSGTMQTTTPGHQDFTIPQDLSASESYTAHVAVASADFPCNDPLNDPELCGNQVKSGPIAIDGTPQAYISVTPVAVITGDTVTLDATATEGHPDSYAWSVTGPSTGLHPEFNPAASVTHYTLDVSGTYTINLTAHYLHHTPLGGLYSDAATPVTLPVSSVSADFTYYPDQPLSTQDVVLCSDSRYSGDIGTGLVGYLWELYENQNLTGLIQSWNTCTTGHAQCGTRCGVVVDESYFPDEDHTYGVKLTLTNNDPSSGGYHDTSDHSESMTVTNGAVNLDFTWSPNSPNIGQTTVFSLSGISDPTSVTWNFGGAGCSGYTQTTICTPGVFTDCMNEGYQYSSGGNKSVSVSAVVGGVTYSKGPKTITVQNAGQCGNPGACTYVLNPSSANYGASGGWGSFAVNVTNGTSCNWTASTSYSWIHITAGSSGSGSGTVTYSVDGNTGGTRTGTITAAQKTFSITQSGSGTVDFTISNPDPNVGDLVTFTAASGFTVQSWDMGGVACDGSQPVINCPNPTLCSTVTWRYSAEGSKSVTLTCAEGSKTKTLTVHPGSCPGNCDKAGPPVASFTMSSNSQPIPAAGVQVGSTVTFTDTSSQNPKVLSLDFTWTPNSPRIGEIVVFQLSGYGSITSVDWDFGGPGCGTYQQHTTCTPGQFTDCTSEAFKFADAGDHTVSVSVNGGGAVHHTVTVQSSGTCEGSCIYTLDPTSATAAAAGGTGTVEVTTAASCTWSAQSNSSWLHVTSSGTYVGPDTVHYSVDANTGSQRSGSMTIAGHNFGVTQAGAGGGGDALPTSWQWWVKLGSQIVATSALPSFSSTFTTAGTYTVILQATNCKGSDTTSQSLVVYEEVIPEGFMVPAVVHSPGANNTVWRSDLRIFNPGTQTIAADLEYRPRDYPNLVYGIEGDIAPDGTLVFNDITGAFNLPDPDNSQGSLHITYNGGDGTLPVVMSRTYNLAPNGTYGQYIPAIPVVPPGSGAIYLPGLVQNVDYRTNLILVNLTDQAVGGLVVHILGADGTDLAQYGAGIDASSFNLLPGISELAGVTQPLDLFTIQVDVGDAQVTAAASVVDNTTGDPTLYSPKPLEDGCVLLPGVAHLPGTLGSTWRSDLILFNPTLQQITARLDYVPETSLPFNYYLEVDLPARQAQKFEDILGFMIGAQANTKGYMKVCSVEGAVTPLVVGRTYDQTTNGTFGQNLEAYGADDLIAAGKTRYIPGVANGDCNHDGIGFRTNLGLVNTSPTTAAVLFLTLYGADGTVVGQSPYTLQAEQFVQFDPFGAIGQGQLATYGSVAVRVDSGGPVAAYASVVDNGTQDPILVPGLIAY